MTNVTQTATEKRLGSGKKTETKAERMSRIVASAAEKETAPTTPVKAVSPPTQPGDQKGVPGDQKGVKATAKSQAKKKTSEQVIKWRAQPKFQLTQKITVLAKENPKSRGAADRFAIYKDGMTVQQYIDAFKERKLPAALAMADMRWDFVAGFIEVK
jgi:hypothetical protein